MTHIIHKMRWEVSVKESDLGNRVDEVVAELAKNTQFLEKLDNTLSSYCPNNERLFIDNLTLDVGKIGAENWQKELEKKLIHELQLQIQKNIPSPKEIEKKEKELLVDLCISLIVTGNLPQSIPGEIKDLNGFKKWIMAQQKERKIKLQAELHHAFITQSKISNALKFWSLNLFWQLFFGNGKSAVQFLEGAKIWEKSLSFSADAVQQIRHDSWRAAMQKMPFQQVVKAKGETWLSIALQSANAKQKAQLTRWAKSQELRLHSKAKVAEKPSIKKVKTDKTETNENEGIFIKNAGFVLFAPFLPQLFKKLNVTQESKVHEFSKALSILHYACYGETESLPLDNTLFKLLLGATIQQLILPENVLTKNEKAEIDAALKSAIYHWNTLKNTSVDGLREGFLYRDGKLQTEKEQIHLRVESRAQDVLLSHLPWSIGIIKLPWMPAPIYVDWA